MKVKARTFLPHPLPREQISKTENLAALHPWFSMLGGSPVPMTHDWGKSAVFYLNMEPTALPLSKECVTFLVRAINEIWEANFSLREFGVLKQIPEPYEFTHNYFRMYL